MNKVIVIEFNKHQFIGTVDQFVLHMNCHKNETYDKMVYDYEIRVQQEQPMKLTKEEYNKIWEQMVSK